MRNREPARRELVVSPSSSSRRRATAKRRSTRFESCLPNVCFRFPSPGNCQSAPGRSLTWRPAIAASATARFHSPYAQGVSARFSAPEYPAPRSNQRRHGERRSWSVAGLRRKRRRRRERSDPGDRWAAAAAPGSPRRFAPRDDDFRATAERRRPQSTRAASTRRLLQFPKPARTLLSANRIRSPGSAPCGWGRALPSGRGCASAWRRPWRDRPRCSRERRARRGPPPRARSPTGARIP